MTCYSDNYRTARTRLLSAAQARGGWTHEAIAHPLAGADGDPLYMDVLWRGPQDATRVLTISSATHGVEGFCGSALQLQLVEDAPALPPDTALMLVHAVNPHGFSHLRRVNEDNIDLNRNFVDFEAGALENDAYGAIDALLNPVDLPAGAMAAIAAELERMRAAMDYLSLLKAVSGGQYVFPRGIQYGGAGPSWSRRMVEALWARRLADRRVVLQIDLHSGLGASGVGMLMMAANDEEPHKALTAEWFGPVLVTPRPRSRADTILGGYMNGAMETQLTGVRVVPMTLEYGTEPNEIVIGSIIEDNWLVHHGDLASEQGREIKARILRAFYPADPTWRAAVLARGREVFTQALTGLAAPDLEERLTR
jgi:predicted deacylase